MGRDARLQVGRGGGLVLRPLGVFQVQQCRGVTQGQESGVGPGVGDGMPGWPGEEVQRVVHELQARVNPGGGHFAKYRWNRVIAALHSVDARRGRARGLWPTGARLAVASVTVSR